MHARWLVVALVAAACTTTTVPDTVRTPTATEQPVRGGDFVHAVAGEPDTLQPVLLPLLAGLQVVDLVYANLVTVDIGGRLKPGLAEWSVDEGGRAWSWVIRADANWSDGRPVTASDVVTTLRAYAMSKKTLIKGFLSAQIEGFADFASGRSDEISGLRVDPADPKRFTLRLVLTSCLNPLPVNVIPAHVFEKHVQEGAGDAIDRAPENDTPPVSSGPFVLSEWRHGEHLRFAGNPQYFGGAPKLGTYTLKVLPTERWAEQLRAGAIHYAAIPAALYGAIPSLEQAPELAILRTEGSGYGIISWNTESSSAPALRDKRVRQALAHAFDLGLAQREIVGFGRPAITHHVPGHWAHPPGLSPYQYDPARARQLLRDAGYSAGGDGLLRKDGQALAFTLETNGDRPDRVRMLQLAVDSYRAIGVQASALIHPSFGPLVERGQAQGVTEAAVGGFELNPYVEGHPRIAWHSGSIPDPTATPPRRGNNWAHFRSVAVDRAIEEAETGPDCSLARRAKLYETVDRILYEEQPGLFGLTSVRIRAVSARLRGFEPNTYGDFDLQTVHLWWLVPGTK